MVAFMGRNPTVPRAGGLREASRFHDEVGARSRAALAWLGGLACGELAETSGRYTSGLHAIDQLSKPLYMEVSGVAAHDTWPQGLHALQPETPSGCKLRFRLHLCRGTQAIVEIE